MDDQLMAAARGLKDIEARVLARYASGESSADTAIVLELQRTEVVRIIKEKGKDSTGYSLNLVKARRDLGAAVIASRPGAPRPAASRAFHSGGDLIAEPRQAKPVPAPPRPAAAPRRATKAAQPSKTITPAPESASPAVDAAAEVRKAGEPVTDRDETTAASTASAPPVAEEPAIREEPRPMTTKATANAAAKKASAVPAPRAADLDFTPAADKPAGPAMTFGEARAAGMLGQPTTAADGDLVLPDGIEDVLTIAEGHASDIVRDLATKIREQVDAVRNALLVDHRAAGLRAQIAEVDADISGLQAEIDVRITKRDQLRKELEELLAGDVIVTASSSPRRAKPAAAAPVDDDEAIRIWAVANHFQIPRNGDIPNGVRAAYHRAQEAA